MTHVVVLAAGRGSRMGTDVPKSLLPVRGTSGTLELLLGSLSAQPWVSVVTVVTGWHAQEVADAARRVLPDVRLATNEEYATSGPLQSLAAGIADLPAQHTWALTADTVCTPAFMAAIGGFAPAADGRTGAVCVKRASSIDEVEAATHVTVTDGWVRGLGTQRPSTGWIHAQAFLWPPWAAATVRSTGSTRNTATVRSTGSTRHTATVRSTGSTRNTSQWQLVDALVTGADPAGPRFRALEVPADSCFDVDTPEDLRNIRQFFDSAG